VPLFSARDGFAKNRDVPLLPPFVCSTSHRQATRQGLLCAQKQPLKNRRAGCPLFSRKQKRFTHGARSALCQSPTFDEFKSAHIAAT
jgi:hypothetical protein